MGVKEFKKLVNSLPPVKQPEENPYKGVQGLKFALGKTQGQNLNPSGLDFGTEFAKQAARNELSQKIQRDFSDPVQAQKLTGAIAGLPQPSEEQFRQHFNPTQDDINNLYQKRDSLVSQRDTQTWDKKTIDNTDYYNKQIRDIDLQIEDYAKRVPNAQLRSNTPYLDWAMRGLSDTMQQFATTALKSPLFPTAQAADIIKNVTGVDVAQNALDMTINKDVEWENRRISANQESMGPEYDVIGTLIQGTAAALPQAALAIATGGASAVEMLPALGGNAGLGTAITSALSKMVQNPTFATSFGQTYGASYNQAIESGVSEDEAQLTAMLVGLINSGIELTGGLETLPGELSKGGSAVKEWVSSMLDEGKEEVVQGIIERLTNKMVYNPDAPYISTTNPDAVFNPVTAAEEFGGGVAIGGILGGGQIGVSSLINGTQDYAPSTEASTGVSTLPAQTNPVEAFANGQNALKLTELEEKSNDIFYQAGKSGIPISNILTKGQIPTQAQLDANKKGIEAYTEKAKADYAKLKTEQLKPGFIKNEYSAQIDKQTELNLDVLAKAAGVKIAYTSKSPDYNGFYDSRTSTVYIAQDATNAALVVAKHEITHKMASASPEQYTAYKDYVLSTMAQEDIGKQITQIKEKYKAQVNQSLTDDQATEEIVANYTETLLTDEAAIARLVKDNRTVAQRFFDAVKAFIARIRKGGANQFNEAERLWLAALKKEQGQGEGVSYSLKSETDNYSTPLTNEQKEYFKNTKAVSKMGRLLRLYHGTSRSFDEFSSEHIGDTFHNDTIGYFLTTAKNEAKYAAEISAEENGVKKKRVIEAYANVENPYEITSKTIALSLFNSGDSPTDYFDVNKDEIVSAAIDGGHDSIIVRSQDGEDALVVAFNPNQIKYANNKKPTQNNDMRYSLKDSLGNTLTQEQAEFFKDSKVRDKDGNLLVVYHGTNADFNIFDKEMVGTNYGQDEKGFFFTDSEKSARQYADNTTYGTPRETPGRVQAAFLNVVNPLTINIDYDPISQWDDNYEKYISRASAKGNDGIIIKAQKYESLFIPFESNQIKSIDNKNPTDDPDIRFSLKDSGVTVYDGEYTSLQSLVDAVKSGELIIHSRRNEGYAADDFKYGLEPTIGETLKETEAYQTSEEYGYEPIPLIFASDKFTWAGGERDAVLFLRKDGFQKSLGDGKVELSDGRIVPYDRSPIADYENPALRDEPAGIETGDWYTTKVADVVAFAPRGISEARYSLKSTANIGAENERLRRMNDKLKSQFKISKDIKTDAKAITKYVSTVLDSYDSNYDKAELTRRITELYDTFANDPSWDDIKTQAAAIAEDILNESSVLNDEIYQQYSGLRSYLKKNIIQLPEQYKSDINGYKAFREQSLKWFNVQLNKGMPIDTVFAELSESWPEFFDQNETSNPADQIQRIADVMADMEPVYENPFAGYMADATEYLAYEIIDNFYEVPQAAPTFAERQARKLTEEKIKASNKLSELREQKNERISDIKAEAQERISNLLERERTRREKLTDKLVTKYESREAAGKERRSRSSYKGRIKKVINDISVMLTSPSDKRHVPEEIKGAVAEFLKSVDLTTSRLGEKMMGRLRHLQAVYQRISDGTADVYMDVDPDLADNIESLSNIENKKVSDMTLLELETLYKIARAVRESIWNYNKTFNENERRTISVLGQTVMIDNGTNKPYNESANRIWQTLKDLGGMDMLSSFEFFEELGGTMNSLFDNLRLGLDKKISNITTAEKYMRSLLGDTKAEDMTGDKAKATEFRLANGSTISLTPAQVMSLYLLNRQEAGQNHIYKGGIKQAPVIATEGKKRVIKKSFSPAKVKLADVKMILDTMTDEQKRIAEGISDFFTGTTAEWGNEVSLKLYGYKKFTEEFYFPIVSDDNYIQTLFAEKSDATLKNMGFTKSRIKNANNPIIIEDVFDVYTRQADKMGSYNAFVLPLSDIQKVYNYKSEAGSVKQAIEKKFGSRANRYFKTFMADINGGIRTEPGTRLASVLTRQYKAAAIGANIRVIVQQPTSYIRAAALVDTKYLARGFVTKPNWKEVLRYSPIAQWRDLGYFSLDVGRQMKDVFVGKPSMTEKFMSAIGKADQFAWGRMWNAVKFEIEATTKLTKGTAEYWAAVSKRFSEVVDRTQVIDTTFHRSQIMRSQDWLVKSLTSFMSEPTKQFNMLRSAIMEARTEKTKAASKRAKRVISSVVSSMIVNAIVCSLIDMWRDDKDNDKSFWEALAEKLFGKGILDGNLAGQVTGMIPFVRELFSIMEGYGADILMFDGFVSLYRASTKIAKYFDSVVSGEEPQYGILQMGKELVGAIGMITGMPAKNIIRELDNLVTNTLEIADAHMGQYATKKLLYNIKNGENSAVFYDLLFRVSPEGPEPDETAYKKIYKDLLAAGFSKGQIDNAMKNRIKKGEAFTAGKSDLKDEIVAKLEGDTLYASFPKEYQEKALDDASEYAASVTLGEVSEYEVYENSWVNKAIEGAKVGFEPHEYILYKTALKVEESKLPLDKDDIAKVISKIDWLTRNERSAVTSIMTGAVKSGVDEDKLMNALVAFDFTDKEKEEIVSGIITKQENLALNQKEYIKFLNGLKWLTNKERDYLFSARYESDKNNPYD